VESTTCGEQVCMQPLRNFERKKNGSKYQLIEIVKASFIIEVLLQLFVDISGTLGSCTALLAYFSLKLTFDLSLT